MVGDQVSRDLVGMASKVSHPYILATKGAGESLEGGLWEAGLLQHASLTSHSYNALHRPLPPPWQH